jgi:hypothetical protein
MTDSDYWKVRYQSAWEQSSKREAWIEGLIKEKTGHELEWVGLGTGTTAFLSGTAAQHGVKKGDPDLRVKGTEIYVEVTGPLVDTVGPSDPLWIRPDKIRNALDATGHETWVVHHLPKDNTIRAILIGDEFKKQYHSGQFKTLNKRIRGATETYVEVPATNGVVTPFKQFIERLKEVPIS